MAKYLVDNQLPVALARHLAMRGLEAVHVRDLGLGSAADIDIADHARRQELVVVSKDEDFVILSNLHGSPREIWIRLGNCRNAVLLESIDRCFPRLLECITSGQRITQVI